VSGRRRLLRLACRGCRYSGARHARGPFAETARCVFHGAYRDFIVERPNQSHRNRLHDTPSLGGKRIGDGGATGGMRVQKEDKESQNRQVAGSYGNGTRCASMEFCEDYGNGLHGISAEGQPFELIQFDSVRRARSGREPMQGWARHEIRELLAAEVAGIGASSRIADAAAWAMAVKHDGIQRHQRTAVRSLPVSMPEQITTGLLLLFFLVCLLLFLLLSWLLVFFLFFGLCWFVFWP